jgi:hypothetical protein
MNAREKILLIGLIVVVGLPALFLGGRRWWWTPLMEYREQAAKLDLELAKVNADVEEFRAGQVRLNKARQRSLSKEDTEQAKQEYLMQYFVPMLKQSGLIVGTTSPGKTNEKLKVVTAIPGVTAVGHQKWTFTVHASGEMSSLVTALENMQKTPYEHRIKSMVLYRTDPAAATKANTKLNIDLTVEVLLVAGTKNKVGTMPKSDLAEPSPPDRQYAQIPTRNIFVGALPPIILPSEKEKTPTDKTTEEKKGSKPDLETLDYIYLTHTSPDEQIAYLYNRIYNKGETKLMAKDGSGYEYFRITDESGNYTFFRAKVLKVDLYKVYIQIKDEVYTMHLGRPLSEMTQYGFDRSTYDLEDEGLFDRDFMHAEMGKSKKNAKGKDNKGKRK